MNTSLYRSLSTIGISHTYSITLFWVKSDEKNIWHNICYTVTCNCRRRTKIYENWQWVHTAGRKRYHNSHSLCVLLFWCVLASSYTTLFTWQSFQYGKLYFSNDNKVTYFHLQMIKIYTKGNAIYIVLVKLSSLIFSATIRSKRLC